MALLHPVVRPVEYRQLLRRGRLAVQGPLLLEEKLDGLLLVVHEGRVYTGAGRRAPKWLLSRVAEAGVDLGAASSTRLLHVEVYGRCLTPGGFHRSDRYCYNAALVDAANPPAHANVWDAPFLSRTLSLGERIDLAEKLGLVSPRYLVMHAERAPPLSTLMGWLERFRGREGYVMKLYSEYGHRLPPDYGGKLRGLLEVKVKHRPQL